MIEKKRKSNREILFYISFSDLLSLLMTMFVLLFSMSTLDSVKFKQLSQSFDTIFNQKTEATQIEEEERILRQLYEKLSAYIQGHHLQDQVDVRMENHTIVLDLGSKLLFPVAKASMLDEAKEIIGAFIGYFKEINEAKIVVEGHTDDTPIHTPEFLSNWELSAARAASVVHFLVENGIKEGDCYIVGFNQYRPLVPNEGEENRAKNRRVRIVFQPVVNLVASQNASIMNHDETMEILDTTQNVGHHER